MRHLTIGLMLALTLIVSPACQHAPPNLSPAGTTAWQNIQATKTLDLVRDLAVDASHTGLITRAEALKVVNWHTAVIKVLDARGPDTKRLLTVSLDALEQNLEPKTQIVIRPYLALVRTVFAAF